MNAPAHAPPIEAVADLLFDGELRSLASENGQRDDDDEREDWIATIPLFVMGARAVDLFFELRAAALVSPRFCHWFAELSPGLKDDDWYRETVQTVQPSGRIEERAALHEIRELEADEVSTVFERKGLPPTAVRRRVRLEVNARYLRLQVRGEASHLRLSAIAGR